MTDATPYLLADRDAELERLQLQSRVWEPAGRALLHDLDLPDDAAVLDAGCGALGWLRILAERFPAGTVVGTDVDERLLGIAQEDCHAAGHGGVRLVRDDLFRSVLPAGMFDLVHARFVLAPLGRADEQLAAYRRLLKPGGVLVVEEPDPATWTFEPYAPATAHLIGRIAQAFGATGGNLAAGRGLAQLLRAEGLDPAVRTHTLGLEAGHPYLRLPLQFAESLAMRLEASVGAEPLARLRAAADEELDDPARRGTTFTLVQAWARVP